MTDTRPGVLHGPPPLHGSDGERVGWSKPCEVPRQSKRFAPLLVSALLGAGVLGSAEATHVAFREDELLCEEALVRLAECCEQAALRELNCDHNDSCGTTVSTDLSPEESECIRERSCASLREQGTCESLLARAAQSSDITGALCQ